MTMERHNLPEEPDESLFALGAVVLAAGALAVVAFDPDLGNAILWFGIGLCATALAILALEEAER